MKKLILSISAGLLFTGFSFAQDILETNVPSVIVNKFKGSYPKANDVEWEKEGMLYKVDFGVGLTKDYKAWYNSAGQRVKLSEDISKTNLPKNIMSKIKTDFAKYRIDDAKKITAGKAVTYSVELKSNKKDWKVVFDSQAKVLSKVAD